MIKNQNIMIDVINGRFESKVEEIKRGFNFINIIKVLVVVNVVENLHFF